MKTIQVGVVCIRGENRKGIVSTRPITREVPDDHDEGASVLRRFGKILSESYITPEKFEKYMPTKEGKIK